MGRRVVVTGVGLATPFGVGRGPLLEALGSGSSAIRPLEGRLALVPPGYGAVLDLPRKEFRNYFDTRVLRLSTMTRQTTLGCIACGDLLEDAGCAVNGSAHPDKGAYLGSFIVPPDFAKQARAARILSHRPEGHERGYVLDDARLDEAMKLASAFDFLRALPNMPSSHLSIQTGYQGPACTYLGSDSSGLQSVTMAALAIRGGLASAMVAGGAFFPFQEVHLSWQGRRGLWTGDGGQGIHPFADTASGSLPGEAGALLYLEDRESAEARGATILAEVIGSAQRFAASNDPDPVGVRADALRAAFPEGSPDWIAPTGIGQAELDRFEGQAFEQAFGPSALDQTAAVTLCAQLGFSGPAAAPLNLIGALLAAQGDVTLHRQSIAAAPGCEAIAGTLGRNGRSGEGATVLASSFSLDGVHAALALRIEG